MQPKTILKNIGLLASALFIVLLVAYTMPQAAAQGGKGKDTVPAKKIKDIDDVLIEIEKAEAEVKRSMQEIDFSKIDKELKEAMKKLDADMVKMQADLEAHLKDIDKLKIQQEVTASLKNLEAVDAEKIRKNVEESIAKIDMEKIKAEVARVKEIDTKKIEEHLKNIQPEIERSMLQAKEDMEKAKAEMRAFKTFIDDLEKEGLINKKEGYQIEIKESTLLINGKEQSAEVYNKHRDFLQKHKNTTIKKTDDDFNIHKQ